MIKVFQYKKGQVKSYSDEKVKCSNLEQIELDITEEELEKIKSNLYILSIEDNKLVIKEGEVIIQEEKEKQKKKEIDDMMKQIEDKYSDLFPLLRKIINK